MAYSDKVIEHYENPRNVGTLDKSDPNVGTGLVGAPACGDVMRLQLRISDEGVIQDAKFKTFGCGSAIASSSLVTEWVKGKTVDEATTITNKEIAKELSLPPVKIHCSVLAEDAIKAAIAGLQEEARRAAGARRRPPRLDDRCRPRTQPRRPPDRARLEELRRVRRRGGADQGPARPSGNTPSAGLRVAVKGGGCSGLAYVMEWAEAPQRAGQDLRADGVRVFVDPKSYLYLMGTELVRGDADGLGLQAGEPQREGRLRVRRELHGLGSRACAAGTVSRRWPARRLSGCGKVQPVAPGTTLFDVLGLPRGVDVSRPLERGYRELSLRLHPDRPRRTTRASGGCRSSEPRSLNEAYKTLRDPEPRAFYLLKLHGRGPRRTRHGRSADAARVAGGGDGAARAARVGAGGRRRRAGRARSPTGCACQSATTLSAAQSALRRARAALRPTPPPGRGRAGAGQAAVPHPLPRGGRGARTRRR